MKEKKWIVITFTTLVILSLLTPFWVFKDLLFPFITSKAFYLRIVIEVTLPFYVYLVLVNKNNRPSFKNPVTIALTAFLFFNIISAIFGVNPLKSFWGNFERMGGVVYFAHLTMLYFYILLLGQLGQQYVRRFLEAVIWSAAILTLDGIMVKLTNNHFLLNDPSFPRVSGFFGNPIFIASFLIIPMFLTVYYLLGESKRWLQIVYGVLAALELYVIYLSGTRGAIVGLAVGIIVAAILYVVLTPNKKIKMYGGIAILVLALTVGLAYTQHNRFAQGSMLRRVFNLDDSNTKSRLIQWGVALHGYKDHPLLGVGAENYYVIANKYYNPEIFQYDPSWFDKPHNYLIEVLVTSGIFGFAAYIAVIGLFIWALWRAYKSDLLTLTEFCLLFAAMISYEFQNLTVFDTIGASVMFFSFVGFGGFLWYASGLDEKASKKKVQEGFSQGFAAMAVLVCTVLVIYFIYVGNIIGLHIAKDINYGYAFSSVDPQTAKGYFDAARNLPFDFDPIQFSSKYGEFAINLASNPPQGTSADFVSKNLQDAIDVEQDAIQAVPNDPTAWEELANLYLSQGVLNKTGLSPKAEQAAQTAMDLAPKRPEPEIMMARLKLAENDTSAAASLFQDVVKNIPADKEAELQLALVYWYSGKKDLAIQTGESVLASGFMPTQVSEIQWLGQAYVEKNEYQSAANVFRLAVKIGGATDLQDKYSLAQMDVKLGNKTEATSIVADMSSQDPKDAAQFQALLK